MNNGADVNEKTSRDGNTLIHALKKFNETDVTSNFKERFESSLNILLKRGMDINVTTYTGHTIFHDILCGSHSKETVKKIIQYGGNINQRDVFGYTPLHICLSYKDLPENVTYLKNRLEIAEMLMNMGADADIRTVNKMTLLMIALRGNCPEHVSLVLNLCPPDVTAVDKFGRTALHHCIIKAKELKGLKEDLEESEIKHNQEIFDMLNTSKMDPDSMSLW